MKNCDLLKVRSWKKCTKQSKFKLFSGSSLALSALQVPGSRAGGCRKQNPLLATYVGRAPIKIMLLWRKFNELSENISLDSKFILVFEIWQFQVADFFFFFQMSIFQNITGLNGLCKGIAFIQMWKIRTCWKFQFTSEKITQKEQIQIFFLLIINLLSPGIHCHPFTLANLCCELSEELAGNNLKKVIIFLSEKKRKFPDAKHVSLHFVG